MGKFLIFLFILFIAMIGYFGLMNKDQVVVAISQSHVYELPKVVLVLLASAVGAGLMLFVFVVRDTRRFLFNIQRQKNVKREDRTKSLYEKALDAYFAERWDDAKHVFEQILKENPEHTSALLKLGDLAFMHGDTTEALEHYSKAHTISPDKAAVLFSMVKVKKKMAALEDALVYVDEIIDLDESNVRALYQKREILEDLGKWDDLIYLQKNIIKKKHSEAEKEEEQTRLTGYKYEYGRDSLENGELEKAQKAFREVIKLNKDFIPAHLGLAEVMFREEHTEEAVHYLETVYGETRSLIVIARLEDLLISIGEPARLIRTYKNSMAGEPDNSILKLFLGKLYHRLEMLDDATEVLDDIDDSASFPEKFKVLGSIYLKRNQPEKAVVEFKKVIDMKKAFHIPYCCSNCGYTSAAWSGRCPSCKEWDTFRFDIFASCKFGSD